MDIIQKLFRLFHSKKPSAGNRLSTADRVRRQRYIESNKLNRPNPDEVSTFKISLAGDDFSLLCMVGKFVVINEVTGETLTEDQFIWSLTPEQFTELVKIEYDHAVGMPVISVDRGGLYDLLNDNLN